jgi:hypothetical protein
VSSSRKNLLDEMSLMTQMSKGPFFRLRLPGKTLYMSVEVEAFVMAVFYPSDSPKFDIQSDS